MSLNAISMTSNELGSMNFFYATLVLKMIKLSKQKRKKKKKIFISHLPKKKRKKMLSNIFEFLFFQNKNKKSIAVHI